MYGELLRQSHAPAEGDRRVDPRQQRLVYRRAATAAVGQRDCLCAPVDPRVKRASRHELENLCRGARGVAP